MCHLQLRPIQGEERKCIQECQEMPAQTINTLYTTISSRGKWKENFSPHLHYNGRGHLQLVNAAGLFTRLDSKKLLSKLPHMHLDFEKLYTSFCSLIRWCTEK
uniref:Uncharacterized protein n=1 Tax=Arundo donax TaxID=35708 RepID=A0A0A9CD17_ARUDO